MKRPKFIDVSSWMLAVVASLSLSSCASWQKVEEPSIFSQKAVNSVFIDEATVLIKNNYLANSGTLSFITSNDPDLATIGRAVASRLRLEGYAVQIVLPPEKRQKGDVKKVEDMSLSGEALAFNLNPLTGSDYVEFSVIVGNSRFAKIFLVKGLTVTEASNWTRLIADDESLINLKEFY